MYDDERLTMKNGSAEIIRYGGAGGDSYHVWRGEKLDTITKDQALAVRSFVKLVKEGPIDA